jgi:TonB-linked SusC/RagA family outer membrane protein
MKLTALLIILGTLQVSAGANAQKVTLHEKDVPLSKVFREIRKQTGYDFFFDAAVIRQAGPVSIDVKDMSLQDALTYCFKNTSLSFHIANNSIVVKEAAPALATAPAPDVFDADTLTSLKGRVTDERGAGLEGVTVSLKGYNRRVTTNGLGEYIFLLVPKNHVLVFSYVGHKTKEVRIGESGVINLVLEEDIAELDQMQVIAYGTTTKRFNTGEQTTVTSKEIEKFPVTNVLTALQAKVPGLFITQTSGQPGSTIHVNIRGQNGLSTGSDPLYIIDGIPYTGGGFTSQNPGIADKTGNGQDALNLINPLDIESVDVLKDAAATSIYGSRAANGVILITTKKGRSGATRVNLNAYSGYNQVPYLPHALNLQQYLEMRHEAKRNDGFPVLPGDYDINGTWDTTKSTNWGKTLVGQATHLSNVGASVSGGNAQTQFLLSGNYRKVDNNEKLFGGSDQTASIHFNMSNTSQDGRFTASLTGGYTYDLNTIPSDSYSSVLSQAPDAPPLYNPDGSLNFAKNTYYNPLTAKNIINKTTLEGLTSSAVISYKLLKELELKATIGYNKQQFNEFLGYPTTASSPQQQVTQGSSNFTTDNNTSWSIEPQANYNRDVSKGHLQATVGYSLQKQTFTSQPLTATGYSSDLLLSSITAGTTIAALPNEPYAVNIYKFNGLYGRVNYIWDNKYVVDYSGRYDGSTKFGPGRRFHFFQAVGANWIFSEEAFMKQLSFLSFGKLRASYGITGNDQISDNIYNSTYSSVPAYQSLPGLYPTNIANPNISWETTKKVELALNLQFFHSRINLEGNFFRNRTSNLLAGYKLPSVTGFNTVTENLPGLVQNQGFDFTLTTHNIRTKSFDWSTTLLFTKQRNQVLTFPITSPAAQQATNLAVGYPPNVLRLFKYKDVNTQTGLYEFVDAKGQTTGNPQLGVDNNTLMDPNPKYFGSIDNSFSYKGFTLDVLFRFVKQIGSSVIAQNATYPPGTAETNFTTAVLKRWQKPGDVTDVQKFSSLFGGFTQLSAMLQSDLAYADASYLRLQNASFSYSFDPALTKKMRVQALRVYLLGENLLTVSRYGMIDPETQSINRLPLVRTITAGIQVTF